MAPARTATKASRQIKSTKPVKVDSESSQEHDDEAGDISGDSQDMANLEIKRLAETMRKSVS